jgi:hypothetical protein
MTRAFADGGCAGGRFCVSISRRSALIVGVCSTLALSGSAVFIVGVPAEAETTSAASSQASAEAAALVASRTSLLERATRAAARADAQRAARLTTLRHQKLLKDRAERAEARKAAEARAARIAQTKAAAADRARRTAEATASRSSVRSVAPSSGSTREIGKRMAADRGWTGDQWTCLNNLWTRESGWRTTAAGYTGAYGIPQALPGRKMASAGSDWRTNPATQIEWGLGYIGGRYGTPCGAWNAFQNKGWY